MRTRITATVALLVALALTGAGAIVYLIEYQNLEEQVADQVDQEFQELDNLATGPENAGQFTDEQALLDEFLSTNVPNNNEAFVSWYDGGVRKMSAGGQVPDTQEFRAAADSIAEDSGTTSLVHQGETYLMSAQTVQVGDNADVGALIVVTYLDDTRQGLQDTMRTYAIVALLALLAIIILAWTQAGRLLAPLRTLRETADEITDTDLSRRLPVTGNDDITALTLTVNRMLDRLESAFVGQRQFLDDAGHELKTPLTILRGHLELLDEGNVEEVAETKAMLLDETDRMARLVGDLILLAKSARPDFVTRRPIDLTELTVDVLAKARGLGDRTWALDGTARVTADLDEQRMTQALLQLCDNAVKHTEPGEVVAIGSSYDAGIARLWVRDSGPGVSVADRERVFQRFGRGPVSQDDEGFGLGLSIVEAIADAHGGTVHVEDVDPHGARFVITLPLDGAAPEPGDDLDATDEDTDDDETQPIRAASAARTEELTLWQGS